MLAESKSKVQDKSKAVGAAGASTQRAGAKGNGKGDGGKSGRDMRQPVTPRASFRSRSPHGGNGWQQRGNWKGWNNWKGAGASAQPRGARPAAARVWSLALVPGAAAGSSGDKGYAGGQ